MSLPLPGYRTTGVLQSSANTTVYEAEDEGGRRVIAKVFDIDDPEVEARAEHEFALLESLDVEGVVKTLDLRRVGDKLILLLERVAGVNLSDYSRGRVLGLDEFFAIAIQIAEILAETHARRVIHRDIKPSNILIELNSGRVYLADFGISVLVQSERRNLHDPAILTGSLPYVAPEQTGRTGHRVDFRSDLYSLGVSFYELLTGQRPFTEREPLALIHAHLARVPAPPSSVRAELPEALSRLIMKLMMKAPERRYQTAAGLAIDLRALQIRRDDSERFALGQTDCPAELRLPQQVYGRRKELAMLVTTLDAVIATKSPRWVVIRGPAGVGKSALLRELGVPVVGCGGYIGRGRFASFGERLYDGLVEVFSDLFEQLLTEDEVELRAWRERLQVTLGGIARVLAELMPMLTLIIGAQPEVPELGPVETRKRLELAFARLIRALGQGERAIVLALDDLDHADPSCLELLDALRQQSMSGRLMLVATARAPASGVDPLATLLGSCAGPGEFEPLELGPLDDEALTALLSDVLGCARTDVESLADIFARKTGRIPSAIGQFLVRLVDEGALQASPTGWRWDERAVDEVQLPDGQVGAARERVEQLGPAARELLECGACVGVRFSLRELELVCERQTSALVATASELVNLGLLADGGTHYRFGHDDIRTVVYDRLAPAEQRRLHLRLGEALRGALGEESTDPELFAAVDQLNAGYGDEDSSSSDRVALARLNLDAGERASARAAHDAARRYFEAGATQLREFDEEIAAHGQARGHYELVVDLRLGLAQSYFFAGEPASAEAVMDALLAWPLTTAHHAKAVATRIRLLRLQERYPEALELGLDALRHYGVPIKSDPSALRAMLGFVRGWWSVRDLDLDTLATCEDTDALAILSVLRACIYPAYRTRFVLYPYLAGFVLRRTRAAGFHDHLAVTIGPAAVIAAMSPWRSEALRLYALQAAAIERMPNDYVRGEALLMSRVIRPLQFSPSAELTRRLPDLIELFREVGLVDLADDMLSGAQQVYFEYGTHLRVLARQFEVQVERLDPSTGHGVMVRAVQAFTCLLIEPEPQPGSDDDAQEVLAQRGLWLAALDSEGLAAGGASTLEVCLVEALNTRYALLAGDLVSATTGCVELLGRVRQVFFGGWPQPQVALTILIACAWRRLFEGTSTAELRRGFRKSLAVVRRWASNSPDGYGHYLDFGEGLRAALRSRPKLALARIERARVGAHAQGCRWIEGLAAETLAKLAAREDLAAFADGAVRHACIAYAAWGAEFKLAQLQRQVSEARLDDLEFVGPKLVHEGRQGPAANTNHGAMLGTRTGVRTRTGSETGSWSTSSERDPDFAVVFETLGVISEDLRLAEVITRVLEAAVTSTSADHGKLLLEREGEAVLAATFEPSEGCRLVEEIVAAGETGDELPASLINFVARTRTPVVLDDVTRDLRFHDDPYFTGVDARSVLALPLTKGDRLLGLLLLENRLTDAGFTTRSVATLQMITAQAGGTLENAQLYAALRSSEARWRALVDGSPDLIILLDERGQVVFHNLGGSSSTAQGLIAQLRDAAPAARWDATLAAVLADGEVLDFELELPPASPAESGSWYTMRFAAIELTAADEAALEHGPRVRNVLVLATDISDKRMLESQVRQQQRLESIGTLASGVAHEINNPIQGIMNYAELITSDSSNVAQVEEFAGEIDHECQRVSSIVRNLLAFSRSAPTKDEECVDIGQMVGATVSLIRAVLRRDEIELELDLPDDLPLVVGNSQQLQQIVMNLVTNARDALNSSRSPDLREQIVIRARARLFHDHAGVRLTVEDRGPGIPPELLGRIFDPFFTTKGRYDGTGLGLSVSHGIAQEHGGELTVESTLGQGTRFFLDLPVAGTGGETRTVLAPPSLG